MDTDVEDLRPRHLRDRLGATWGKVQPPAPRPVTRGRGASSTDCAREEEPTKSPLPKVDPPQHNEQTPEIMPEDEVRSLLKACDMLPTKNPSSMRFDNTRDPAHGRLMPDIGPRAWEITGILLADIDLKAPSIRTVGKGCKIRTLPRGKAGARLKPLYASSQGSGRSIAMRFHASWDNVGLWAATASGRLWIVSPKQQVSGVFVPTCYVTRSLITANSSKAARET